MSTSITCSRVDTHHTRVSHDIIARRGVISIIPAAIVVVLTTRRDTTGGTGVTTISLRGNGTGIGTTLHERGGDTAHDGLSALLDNMVGQRNEVQRRHRCRRRPAAVPQHEIAGDVPEDVE